MRGLRRATDALIGLAAAIGAAGLWLQVGLILADVIGRGFGAPIGGAQDVTTMAFVILVFGGMAICDRTGGHVSVDVLEQRYPPALNRLVDFASAVLGAAIFLAIAWAVWESAKLSVMLNLSTNILTLPKAWFQWALTGFALLTALAMTLRAAELALTGRNVCKEPVNDL